MTPSFVTQKLLVRNLALNADGVNGNVRTCLNREILCLEAGFEALGHD
jgi:hypothetical protein